MTDKNKLDSNTGNPLESTADSLLVCINTIAGVGLQLASNIVILGGKAVWQVVELTSDVIGIFYKLAIGTYEYENEPKRLQDNYMGGYGMELATTKNKLLNINKGVIDQYKTNAIDVDYFEIEPLGANEIPAKCKFKANNTDLINTLKCFIGVKEYGKQQCIDFYADGSLLIGGASRQGKTSLIYSILLSLMDRYDPNYLRIILVDFKQVDLVRIDKYKHIMNTCITDMERFKNMLGQMEIECDKRTKYFRELEVANIQDFNEISSKKIRPILIVIDEIAQVLVGKAKEVDPLKDRLHKLICKSMAFGIYWVVCTQELSRDTLGKMKINFTQTVGLKCKDKTASDLVIKDSELDNIKIKGRAKIDNSEGVIEFQPYLVTLDNFKDYLKDRRK